MARNESVTVRPHRGTASNHAAPLDAKGSAPEIANDVFAPWQAANPQLISVSLDEAAIVAITDAAGRIVHCNEMFCRISGYSRAELIGATHSIVNSGTHGPEVFADLYRTIRSGGIWRGTLCNRRKDGGLYWVDTTIVPHLGADGRSQFFTAVRFDVTGHINALADLAGAQASTEAALRAKDEFVANMSHEIRTPLNGVVGVASALARTDLTAQQHEMVDLILRAGNSLAQVLSDILDLSTISAGRVELDAQAFDLQREVRAAVELMGVVALDKGIGFSVEFAESARGLLCGDAARLRQVIANFASNAVKFTEAGAVRIRVRVDEAPEEIHPCRLDIEFEDSGIGFDVASFPNLLEPFSQADQTVLRRHSGAGVGLAICKSLIGLMGGELTVSSIPGKGSHFRFVVPISRAPDLLDAAQEPLQIDVGAEPIRVLLAEDHPVNRKVVDLLLSPIGANLTMAEDGVQAVERFRDERFDLILMDIQMPNMDGLTATRQIRQIETFERRPRTPIAMLTANSSNEHRRQALAAGADVFIAKPVTAESLFTGIEALLTLQVQRAGAPTRGRSGVRRKKSADPATAPTELHDGPPVMARSIRAVEQIIADLPDRTLLLVEDDEILGNLLARQLRAKGFEVTAVASVADALASVNQAPPAFAVLDLHLRDGSGLSICETVHRLRPDSRVLMLSGYGDTATAVAAVKRGATDYLLKPTPADDLVAALLAADGERPDPPLAALTPALVRWEHIQAVLEDCEGHITEAAHRLRMHRRTLQRILSRGTPS